MCRANKWIMTFCRNLMMITAKKNAIHDQETERKLLTDYLSVKVKTQLLLWYFTLIFCLYLVCCPDGCSSNFVECLFNLNSNFQNSPVPPSIVYHLGRIQRICDIRCNNSLCRCCVRIKRTTSLKYYIIPKSNHTQTTLFNQNHPCGCVTWWASKKQEVQ